VVKASLRTTTTNHLHQAIRMVSRERLSRLSGLSFDEAANIFG
jgi:hypothetical protein